MQNSYSYTKPSTVEFPVPLIGASDPRLKNLINADHGEIAHVTLLGIPFDEGVGNSGGRPGTAGGPDAIRQAILKYGTTYNSDHLVDFSNLRLADAGNIDIVPGDVEATHDRLTVAVAEILATGSRLILLGGGHDATFGSVRGLSQIAPKYGGVNVDAHLDMRQVVDGKISSGTPYRRILEILQLPGENLVELALGNSVNSRSDMEFAVGKGVKCWTVANLRRDGMERVCNEQLDRLSERCEALFFSIDMDGFSAAFAPGVSAPATEGLTPEEGFLLAFGAGKRENIRLFELMELNPKFDIDHRTSRLAVNIITCFLAGIAAGR